MYLGTDLALPDASFDQNGLIYGYMCCFVVNGIDSKKAFEVSQCERDQDLALPTAPQT